MRAGLQRPSPARSARVETSLALEGGGGEECVEMTVVQHASSEEAGRRGQPVHSTRVCVARTHQLVGAWKHARVISRGCASRAGAFEAPNIEEAGVALHTSKRKLWVSRGAPPVSDHPLGLPAWPAQMTALELSGSIWSTPPRARPAQQYARSAEGESDTEKGSGVNTEVGSRVERFSRRGCTPGRAAFRAFQSLGC
jgi:hypothetical protein